MSAEVKVFISYSHIDSTVVGKIIKLLNQLGIPYFLDKKDITLAQDVHEEVLQGMRTCTHILVVISPGSLKSNWVPYEIGLAKGRDLDIVLYLTHPSLDQDLPTYIRNLRYAIDINELKNYFEKLTKLQDEPRRNPKPFRVGEVLLRDVYLMLGNYTVPIEIVPKYVHQPLELPPEIARVYPHLDSTARAHAQRLGTQYFNGPNTRLIRFTEEGTRQDAAGHEQKVLTLQLGPVSWFEYTILNTFLDYRLDDGQTIREVFADPEKLFQNDRDLSWCKLSNILGIALTPITNDGFGLVQKRNPRGVSAEGGKLTSGLAENIHRYLDEANPKDPTERLNELGLPAQTPVDERYAPQGVPSPILCAQRCLWEELSEDLGYSLPITAYRFLLVGFELAKFHPVLMGVVELDMSREEVERTREKSPGRDHSEFLDIVYLPLDSWSSETINAISLQEHWVPAGLAAFMAAVNYFESRREAV
jgi:hypothetical protein